MRVSVLSENTTSSDSLKAEHGISFHIADKGHNILFDLGGSDNFVHNAEKMGIDIGAVDMAVISHGHDDHGGGMRAFLDANTHANIYVHALAFGEYYSRKSETLIRRIGLDTSLRDHPRVVLLEDDTRLLEGVETMQNVVTRYPLPVTNANLYEDRDGAYTHDTFRHEQNLVIELSQGYVLFAGCAHNGIVNIIEHARTKYGTMPRYVFGGFHLSSRTKSHASDEEIDRLGEYLFGTGAMFYTCHCTGTEAYKRLKAIMGAKIEYFSTGCAVDIE